MVGLISDTHGLLRPQALSALAGCAVILHAGDIGREDVLTALRRLAPLHAVRGNNDHGAWAMRLPQTQSVEIAARTIYLLHDVHEMDLDPARERIGVVVSGHSHRPSVHEENGVLFVNPGSAGPRRFRLPIGVARLHLGPAARRAELVELSP